MEQVRDAVIQALHGRFGGVAVNEWGSVVVSFPEMSVHCKFSAASDGGPVVLVQAPVFLNIPTPEDEVYELICLIQSRIGFGSLAVIGASTGAIHLMVNAHLLGDAIPSAPRAVQLVHDEAIAQVHVLRVLKPESGA